jgi:hypothetical protein
MIRRSQRRFKGVWLTWGEESSTMCKYILLVGSILVDLPIQMVDVYRHVERLTQCGYLYMVYIVC